MITYGLLLWHLSVAGLLVLIGALSSRLGKAMRDDIADVRFFSWAAGFVALAGVFHASSAFWAFGSLVASLLGLVGFGLGAWAGWKTWGWIPAELKRGRKGGT